MATCEEIEGTAIIMRCVRVTDAGRILELRNDPDISKFLPPLNVSVEQQENWIGNQIERENEYYFAAASKRQPNEIIGLTSLYAYRENSSGKTIEWGRFLVAKRSLFAVEISYLTHMFAFEQMLVDEVYGYSVLENVAVQSFHRSCGLKERGISNVKYDIRGKEHETYCFYATSHAWPAIKERMKPMVELAARFAAR